MRNRLLKLVEASAPSSFLTLTIDANAFPSPQAAARRMNWAFPRLIAKMRRFVLSGGVEYLAVWERTRAGWPHIHALLKSEYIPQPLISRWWRALAGSPVVYIEAVTSARGGGRYVAKYLVKDPDPFNFGRAIRASRGFLVEPMRPQGTRYCTLGPVRIYEGRAWEWLENELAALRVVSVDDDGGMLSAPWSRTGLPDLRAWLLWERQRRAVAAETRPPQPPTPLMRAPPWAERTPSPAPEPPEGAAPSPETEH
jgi:hypothetical protein